LQVRLARPEPAGLLAREGDRYPAVDRHAHAHRLKARYPAGGMSRPPDPFALALHGIAGLASSRQGGGGDARPRGVTPVGPPPAVSDPVPAG